LEPDAPARENLTPYSNSAGGGRIVPDLPLSTSSARRGGLIFHANERIPRQDILPAVCIGKPGTEDVLRTIRRRTGAVLSALESEDGLLRAAGAKPNKIATLPLVDFARLRD